MKKIFILTLSFFVSSAICAQLAIKLDINYDRIATQKGELYQYGSYYLSISDVQTANDTSYVLRSISLSCDTIDKQVKPKYKHRDSLYSLPAPISEDAIMATNTAKKAESVAKQIYRIREAKMNLLAGEAEHTPADAGSLRQMISGLNKMEKQLTELFTGTKNTQHYHKIITYRPTQTEDIQGAVLMRFSKFEGPVSAEDLSGVPIYIDVKYIREEVIQNKKKKNDPVPAPIKGAYIKIYSNDQMLAEGII